MEAGLAEVLLDWRGQCVYNRPEDYVFASVEMNGKQPLWPNSAMEKHIKPAAIRVGIQKQIGWHTLRHYAEYQKMPNAPVMSAGCRVSVGF